jgi:hypothetical protein
LDKLKFLGLEYDPGWDCLRASTRNGAKLVFDKHELVQAIKARDLGTRGSPDVKDHDLPKSPWGMK